MVWETAYSLAQESVDPWVFVLAQGSAQATEEAKAHCSGQKVAAWAMTLVPSMVRAMERALATVMGSAWAARKAQTLEGALVVASESVLV